MKVVIITSVDQGLASRCIPELMNSEAIELLGVIRVTGVHPDRRRRWRLKVRKILHIGLCGAINGYRMRNWFADNQAEPLTEVCSSHDVKLLETPYLNSPDSVKYLRQLRPDLGLSLGNGFMAPSLYEAPRLDMLNVHCERLPAYQNASSVIWPLFNGEQKTGLCVHRIAREIDTGDILYQEQYPIVFRNTLAKTVTATTALTYGKVPTVVRRVCEQYPAMIKTAQAQHNGCRYTTPSLRQYWQMKRNHKHLLAQQSSSELTD